MTRAWANTWVGDCAGEVTLLMLGVQLNRRFLWASLKIVL